MILMTCPNVVGDFQDTVMMQEVLLGESEDRAKAEAAASQAEAQQHSAYLKRVVCG